MITCRELSTPHFTRITSYSSSLCLRYLCIDPTRILFGKQHMWMLFFRASWDWCGRNLGGKSGLQLPWIQIYCPSGLTNSEAWLCLQLHALCVQVAQPPSFLPHVPTQSEEIILLGRCEVSVHVNHSTNYSKNDVHIFIMHTLLRIFLFYTHT